MAVEGFFHSGHGGTPAPYVQGHIDFPRLGATSKIYFLIDTGSDSTSLHLWDIGRLQIDYRRLRGSPLRYSRGVGGSIGYYLEPAWLMFIENTGERRFCELEVHICEMTYEPAMRGLPSLLGRDFLNRCSVHLDSSQNRVSLEPLNVAGDFIQPPTTG